MKKANFTMRTVFLIAGIIALCITTPLIFGTISQANADVISSGDDNNPTAVYGYSGGLLRCLF